MERELGSLTDEQLVSICDTYLTTVQYMDDEDYYNSVKMLSGLKAIASTDFQRACVLATYHKAFTGEYTLCCLFD